MGREGCGDLGLDWYGDGWSGSRGEEWGEWDEGYDRGDEDDGVEWMIDVEVGGYVVGGDGRDIG